jgi:hypothetical protein
VARPGHLPAFLLPANASERIPDPATARSL